MRISQLVYDVPAFISDLEKKEKKKLKKTSRRLDIHVQCLNRRIHFPRFFSLFLDILCLHRIRLRRRRRGRLFIIILHSTQHCNKQQQLRIHAFTCNINLI